MKIWLYTEFWEIRVLSSHSPPPPSLEGVFPSLPRILCLTQVTVIEASARLKLVLEPFSSLYFVIGHLEKSFPQSIMQSSQMDKINTIRRVYIVQYRIVFWFHLANLTLIKVFSLGNRVLVVKSIRKYSRK